MTYSTSAPPALLVARVGSGPAIWSYSSTDDDATVNGADYFSNGDALGMVAGDMVWCWDSTNSVGSVLVVSSVTAGGAATTAFAAVA